MILRLGGLALVSLAVASACGIAGNDHSRQRQSVKAATKTQHATISKVTDGDTIHVKLDGVDKTVRLIGIDTPETHKPGVKVECGGREASANMARLAPMGAKATLTPDPGQDSVDRYGRMLAYVWVNHRSLQLEQIYAGWAEVYIYRGKPFARAETYQKAEGVAKRGKRGVWGACGGDFHSLQTSS